MVSLKPDAASFININVFNKPDAGFHIRQRADVIKLAQKHKVYTNKQKTNGNK